MPASKTAAIDAVRRLDLQRLETLLAERPSLLSTRHRDGSTLLHLACAVPPPPSARTRHSAAQVRVADLLLDRGLPIDAAVGRDRCTPLFFAVARARNPALVRRLISRGARPAAAPGGGLFAAGWWEDLEILELLLAEGAPIDVVVGVTPFLACWCWRRIEAAKCLARHGADVNHQDPKGRTALHHGVEKDFDPAWLRWLVRHGASPDIDDRDGVSARRRAARKRNKAYLAALA